MSEDGKGAEPREAFAERAGGEAVEPIWGQNTAVARLS